MPKFTRRQIALMGAASVISSASSASVAAPRATRQPRRQRRPPNIVIFLADDLGYGDLGCYGHPLIRTPNIDRLAREGQRWTSFYASAPMCGPSREGLMTGRMPIRIHGTGKNGWNDIPDAEFTLGELLKGSGYATAYVGKWGLSGTAFTYRGAHPNDQGFDYFYGLAASNDAGRLPGGAGRTYENIKDIGSTDFAIPLYRQRDVIESPVEQATLTQRYTQEAVRWARQHADRPFFLYLAYSAPHVPIFAPGQFKGRSEAGLYGDVVEELDWSVGQVLQALHDTDLADDTLIIFTSDNGPWLTYYDLGGSAGPWRDGKLTAWEGAYRVPGIFRWPGKIEPAVVDGIGVNVDLMGTIASVVGASLPSDRSYDSIDLSSTLFTGKPSPRNEWLFYGPTGDLWAARVGNYKLVYESWDSIGPENVPAEVPGYVFKWSDRGYGNHVVYDPPVLFDLSVDLRERRDVAAQHPEVIAQIQQAVANSQFRPRGR